MSEPVKMNEEISVGGQPAEADLQALAGQGFKSIINLRLPGEEQQPLSPAEEGAKARELGLHYAHIPVSAKNMKDEQVDQFRQELERLPKPVFVHCKSGKRADAFVTMGLGANAGLSGEQALEEARQKGFQYDLPEMRAFMQRYLDKHKAG